MNKLLTVFFSVIFTTAAFGQTSLDYKTKADNSFKNKEYAHARDYYTKALDSTDLQGDTIANVYFMRAGCYNALHDFNNALNDYTSAINYKHNFVNAYFDRAGVYGNLNEYSHSVDDFNKCIALTTAGQRGLLKYIYNGLAYAYFRVHEIDSALKYSVSAIQEDVNWGNSFYTRGMILEYQKKYSEAIECFDRAIANTTDDNKPLLALCYLQRANSKRLHNNSRGAIKDYDDVLKLDPDNKEASWNRAYCYNLTKDFKSAVDGYTHTISLYPGDNVHLAMLLSARGENENELNLFSDAINDDSVAISMNPDVESIYMDMAVAYSGNGDYTSAIKKCQVALAFSTNTNPEISLIYTHIGENEYKLKQDMDAMSALNKAIQVNPKNMYAYYIRGLVSLYRIKNTDQATVDFNKVLDLDTTKKSHHYMFSLYFTGRQDQAMSILQNLLANPDNYVAERNFHYDMACFYAMGDRQQEANEQLKMAVDKGYSKEYVITDECLNNIRNTDDYKSIMNDGK